MATKIGSLGPHILLMVGLFFGIYGQAAGETQAASPTAKSVDQATLRHVQNGAIVGHSDEKTLAWSGIPFAKAPVGPLRWRAPLPPESWTGTRDASQYGSSCPQVNMEASLGLRGKRLDAAGYLNSVEYSGNEDCLYLNVRAPRPAPGHEAGATQRLPVMVFIHGGGNISGSGEWFDSSALVAGQDVVLVTINYRLGNFGFFTHPALRAQPGTAADRSGNYAVLDQIQALHWVHDNIAVFGGDPGNVTIFGVSGGGVDTLSLLSSPLAAGLFHRAIPMSGFAITRSVEEASHYTDAPTAGFPHSSGELLLQLLIGDGKAKNRAAAKAKVTSMTAAETAIYLRGKSYADFDRAYAALGAVNEPSQWVGSFSVRDGAVIPAEGIAASFAKPRGHNAVPVMIGTLKNEDNVYLPFDAAYADVVAGAHGKEYRFKDMNGYRLVAEYMARLWKAVAADELAAVLTQNQSGTVFAYRLDWAEVAPWDGPDHEPHGATHGMDLPLIFGWPPAKGPSIGWSMAVTEKGRQGYRFVSEAIMSYWTQFAYTGKPGKGRHGELPEWQAWNNTPGTPKFMILDSAPGGGLRMSPDGVTKAGVLNHLLQDGRLPTLADKCGLLRKMVVYSTNIHRFTAADYKAFSGGICEKGFPIAGTD